MKPLPAILSIITQLRWWLGGAILAACPLVAEAQRQPQPQVHLIYKDGFSIKGRVHEKSSIIFDSASGRPFPVFSGKFYLEDFVRNIVFSPDQVGTVAKIKPAETRFVERIKRYQQSREILPWWEFEGFSDWNERGERTATYRSRIELVMQQKVANLTPRHIFVFTDGYIWDLPYFTQEFGPKLTRDILFQTYKDNSTLKTLKDSQKLIEIAAFMQEAGWYKEAEHELRRCLENFPEEKKLVQEKLEQLKVIQTTLFVESIEQAAKAGQHQEAIDRLGTYNTEKYDKLVSPDLRIKAQDLTTKYDKAKTDLELVRTFLKDLPALTKNGPAWRKACEPILDDLNYDTIDRLETFVTFAQQFDNDLKAKKKPNQSAEEVLAMAVSGWLQGNQAADPDVKIALKLARARELVLEFLLQDDAAKRANKLSAIKNEIDLPADVMARLVKMIPPPRPENANKLGTNVTTMKIEVPDSDGGSYLLQLPPSYHHLRAYPMLMVLHGTREKAEETLKRFAPDAAKQGVILVAPLWGKGKYQFSAGEHAVALDTLRDVRRRLQIDSDRVFLFGWEQGANMACDVALGHPDLFAGVMTMNLRLPLFTRRYYWPNAQYLPLYLIDGERNKEDSKAVKDLFKDWSREPYRATFVEYKGRGTEWYSVEVPTMFDWMSRKKRHHPLKEMGHYKEEFNSTRPGDNRFYWLSCEGISERCELEHNLSTWPQFFQPAKIQAAMSVGNKAGPKQEANIWNQIDVQVSGFKQATVWLTPNMLDYSKPLLIRVNTREFGGKRLIQPSVETMLEELFRSGDRQRLYMAKIDIKI